MPYHKEGRDHQIYYQILVQKPTPVLIRRYIIAYGNMGSLQIWIGTINAVQALIFYSDIHFRRELAYLKKIMSNHILHVLQQHGSMIGESEWQTALPTVQ